MMQLAGNAGGYRTMQEDQQMALQQQAADLHRQQVMDAIQGGQQREAVNALQFAMGDQRQREINAINAGTRLATADLNGQYGVQRTQAQQEGANTRTADQVSAREREGQANRDNRTQINGQNNDVRQGIAADNNAARYYGIDQQARRDADRARERVALEAARTGEQQLRAQGRLQNAAQLAQLHAAISEKSRQRQILEGLINNGKAYPNAAHDIDRLTGEIQGLVDRIVPPSQPSSTPAAPPPTPYDAQQPGMAQPAPSMSNPALQTGMPGPQSMGQPQQPVRVATVDQARRLPPGTQFLDPYGTLRVA